MTKISSQSIGLYLHIPFCAKRCAYCDFYSSFLNRSLMKDYTLALIRDIKEWGGKINRPISSLYLGGGTPSLLEELLPDVTNTVFENFSVNSNAEITLEVNPSSNLEKVLEYSKKAGINRLSIGMQSGNDDELQLLGRTHTAKDTENTVKLARKMGFNNISLDIMLGLPDSNISSLKKSLDFALSLNPEHISAYILKIEENTLFHKNKDTLNLPDDDDVGEQYLFMCRYLKENGFRHYEISNFCKQDRHSRHNTLYWKGKEYLGLGASAHSFLDGKRFYFESNIKSYISCPTAICDSVGGGKEEYILLNLRLDTGINFKEYKDLFNEELPKSFFDKAENFEKIGLLEIKNEKIALTDVGMLVSNSIITELLEEI